MLLQRVLAVRWVLLFTVLAVAAVGAAGAYWASRLPGAAQQLPPPNGAPLLVTISTPLNGSSYPANSHIPVTAKARGAKPLSALELWVDGQLVERRAIASAASSRESSATWRWRPPQVGEHTLLVRGIDSSGAVGNSNTVRVRATEEVAPRLLHVAGEGDVAEIVARPFGASPQQLAAANPGLDVARPLAAGQQLLIPLVAPGGAWPPPRAASSTSSPPASLGPIKDASIGEPSGFSLWLEKQTGSSTKPPVSPGLAAKAEGCDVRLLLLDQSEDEDGFFVYRLDPGSPAFQRVATLGGSGGKGQLQYLDRGLSGHLEYYVASFNLAGESPGSLAGTTIADPSCEKAHPGGANPLVKPPSLQGSRLRLELGKLILPEPLDVAYFYLSVNKGSWTRVPEDPNSFLPPGPDGFDLGKQLDPLVPAGMTGKITLDLEVWGWKGGSLVFVGNISKTIDKPATSKPLPQPVVGKVLGDPGAWFSDGSSLRMCLNGLGQCKEGFGALVTEGNVHWDQSAGASEFHWSTDAGLATSGIWQVSVLPFADAFDPEPPGLVAIGVAYGGGGSFLVNFFELSGLKKNPPPAGQPPATEGSLQLLPVAIQGLGGDHNGAGGAEKQPGQTQDGVPWHSILANLRPTALADAASRLELPYYVRVTPMLGTTPVGKPSNNVLVHFRHSVPQDSPYVDRRPDAPVPPLLYDITGLSFTAMRDTLPGMRNCVRVVRNEAAPDAFNPYSQVLPGQILCPAPYKGEGGKSWYEALWDFVSGAVNWISESFEWVKGAVVSFVANMIPGCGEGCQNLLMGALEVGLSAIGVPPELPTFKDLTDMGIDYLVENIAGIPAGPCDFAPDTCRDTIKAGLQAAFEAQASNSTCKDAATAHSLGYEPMCFPEGVVTEPAEGSLPEPAKVVVQLRRRSDVPPDLAQGLYKLNIAVAVDGYNDSYVGATTLMPYWSDGSAYGYLQDYVTIEKPLQGTLFSSNGADLPWPTASKTDLLTVPFGGLRPVDYWVPEHLEMIKKHGNQKVKYNDWWMLYWNGTATVKVSVSCTLDWGTVWKYHEVYPCAQWKEAQFPLPGSGLDRPETMEVAY